MFCVQIRRFLNEYQYHATVKRAPFRDILDSLTITQCVSSCWQVVVTDGGVPTDEWRVVGETTGTVAATANDPAQAAEYREEMNDQLTRQEVYVLRQPLEDVPGDGDG